MAIMAKKKREKPPVRRGSSVHLYLDRQLDADLDAYVEKASKEMTASGGKASKTSVIAAALREYLERRDFLNKGVVKGGEAE